MSQIYNEIVAANGRYAASFGAKATLPMPPRRHFAILTCMDARLDPAKYAGLAEGDAHVIRNAGGRATDDAIRSLVISYKLLGTREWFVITTPTAAWRLSPTTSCAGCWPAACNPRHLTDKSGVTREPGQDQARANT